MRKSSLIFFTILFLYSSGLTAKIRNPFKMPPIIMLTLNTDNNPAPKDNIKALLNSLVLSGILNNEVAIINHQFYREGDQLKVFTIEKINSNNVILVANGKRYELILNFEKEVKEFKKQKTLNKEPDK